MFRNGTATHTPTLAILSDFRGGPYRRSKWRNTMVRGDP